MRIKLEIYDEKFACSQESFTDQKKTLWNAFMYRTNVLYEDRIVLIDTSLKKEIKSLMIHQSDF